MEQSRQRRWPLWLALALILPATLFAAYTWLVLNWSYSTGDRAGYVQKFSNKGWVCKTWEGELAMVSMPGTMSEKFLFTVRSDTVATRINQSLGKKVSITYEQHVGVPTACFGETAYYVTDIRTVD